MSEIQKIFHVLSTLKNIFKDSCGPLGLDILVQSALGKFIISNDGHTVLDNITFTHSLGKSS
jgi:chaperonin GroEL (HSP60 family)